MKKYFLIVLILLSVSITKAQSPSLEDTISYIQTKSRSCSAGRLESMNVRGESIEISIASYSSEGRVTDKEIAKYSVPINELYSNLELLKDRRTNNGFVRLSCSDGTNCISRERSGTEYSCKWRAGGLFTTCKGGRKIEPETKLQSSAGIWLCKLQSDSEKIVKALSHLIEIKGGEKDLF